jgi:hypothetical protein
MLTMTEIPANETLYRSGGRPGLPGYFPVLPLFPPDATIKLHAKRGQGHP